jgi:hypothetical protein
MAGGTASITAAAIQLTVWSAPLVQSRAFMHRVLDDCISNTGLTFRLTLTVKWTGRWTDAGIHSTYRVC